MAMKKTPKTAPIVWGVATALAVTLGAPAQSSDLEALIEKRDAKLAGEWRSQAQWVVDFDQAREQSKKSGEIIFAYFTRSYAP